MRSITAPSRVIESVYKYRGWFQCGCVQNAVGVKKRYFFFLFFVVVANVRDVLGLESRIVEDLNTN